MLDAATNASLATAVGTLALAGVTLAAVRSSNRSARIAERSMLAGLRPLVLGGRLQDPLQKVGFGDQHWVRVPGGHGSAEVTPEAVYLTASIWNAGTGLALLHGWALVEHGDDELPRADPVIDTDFRRLTRDLYVAGRDTGFWQGAIRDRSDPDDAWVRGKIERRQRITVDVLYGDQDGSQRTVSRLLLNPMGDGDNAVWLVAVSRHWYLDRPNPR